MERKRIYEKPTWMEVGSGITLGYHKGVWGLDKGQVLQTPDDKILLFQDKNGIHEIAYSDDKEIIVNGQSIPLRKFKFKLDFTPGYEVPKNKAQVFLEYIKAFWNSMK